MTTHRNTAEQDRELLELAARAAGIGPLMSEPYSLGGTRYFYREDDYPSGATWNPLTDDGDALRLAVKLRLDVMTCCYRDEIQIGGQVRATTFQPIDGADRCAAVRRAITRAAAAIAQGERK